MALGSIWGAIWMLKPIKKQLKNYASFQGGPKSDFHLFLINFTSMFYDFGHPKVVSGSDTSRFLKTLKTIVGVIKIKGSSLPQTFQN